MSVQHRDTNTAHRSGGPVAHGAAMCQCCAAKSCPERIPTIWALMIPARMATRRAGVTLSPADVSNYQPAPSSR